MLRCDRLDATPLTYSHQQCIRIHHVRVLESVVLHAECPCHLASIQDATFCVIQSSSAIREILTLAAAATRKRAHSSAK